LTVVSQSGRPAGAGGAARDTTRRGRAAPAKPSRSSSAAPRTSRCRPRSSLTTRRSPPADPCRRRWCAHRPSAIDRFSLV